MWRWILGAVSVVAVSGLFGYTLGSGASGPVWLTGAAHVSVDGEQAGFKVVGWYYGFSASTAWYDARGSFHESGWPACLNDQTRSARFLTVAQPIETVGKPVLAVDCR